MLCLEVVEKERRARPPLRREIPRVAKHAPARAARDKRARRAPSVSFYAGLTLDPPAPSGLAM